VKVLVSAGSKHGATAEIARWIGDAIAARGLTVDVRAPDDVGGLEGYDAAVLGSAVYAGRWVKEARQLAEQLAGSDMPVWLFSSGPIGDPPKPDEDPGDITEITQSLHVREHRLFAGKLDRSKLNFGERAIVSALRAPQGDFRDRAEIVEWAGHIAGSLTG
jgi:menaquinone-dependent protoporphyrinogen oxidase